MLGRSIEHIRQVVQVQQSHAKEIILRQLVSPAELMEDAVRVNQSSLEQHGIQVVREFAEFRRSCSTSTGCCKS